MFQSRHQIAEQNRNLTTKNVAIQKPLQSPICGEKRQRIKITYMKEIKADTIRRMLATV